MKIKKYLFIPFLLTILVSALFTSVQVKPAFAQEQCLDAAGAPIPCPPTVEIPCGQPGGPACPATEDKPNPTARPTKTPFPLANPTEETVNAGASWSGSCSGGHSEIVNCMGKLANSCGASKGTYDIDINDDGSHTLTCTLPAVVDPSAPLPLVVAPIQTPLPDENYLGSCSNDDRNVFDCFEQFKCDDGLLVIKVDLYSGNGTKYDFYCIPDANIPQLDLPIAIADPEGKTGNWSGICNESLNDACLVGYIAACTSEGGTYKYWQDEGGGTGVYCENQSEASRPAPEATALPLTNPTPEETEAKEDWHKFCSNSNAHESNLCIIDASSSCTKEGGTASPTTHEDGVTIGCSFPVIMQEPTPLPLAAAGPTRVADGDWVGGCNFGDNYDFCMEDYKASCNNEGGVYNESHDDGGSNVSCSDTTAGRPNGGFPGGLLPWAGGGLVGLLIGLLLPAIQKVREAAARTKTQSREHILLNKDDGGTEASDYLLEIDGIKGESKAHIKKAVLHVRKAGGEQEDNSPQDPEDDTLGGWDVKANKKV